MKLHSRYYFQGNGGTYPADPPGIMTTSYVFDTEAEMNASGLVTDPRRTSVFESNGRYFVAGHFEYPGRIEGVEYPHINISLGQMVDVEKLLRDSEKPATTAAKHRKIIAIDFDGTLCTNRFPNIGEPIPSVIDMVKAEQANGARLILWTCRIDERLTAAVQWCAAQGLHFDAINENLPDIIEAFGGDTRKVFANEYWDDRAVRIP